MTRLRLPSPIDLTDYDEAGPARKKRRQMEGAASSAPPHPGSEEPPLLVPQDIDPFVAGARNTAEDACLAQVFEVFPDISHEYVRELFDSPEITRMRSDGHDSGPLIVDAILAQSQYPKQKDQKRKRETNDQSDDPQKQSQFWEQSAAPQYIQACVDILALHFPKVPVKYIRDDLVRHKRLYTVYESLYQFEFAAAAGIQLPYDRLRSGRRSSKRPQSDLQAYNTPIDDAIARELRAVKTRCEQHAASLRQKKELEDAEKRNEEVSRRDGALVECSCCYADIPANRCVACEGDEAHFFCYDCIKRSADTQVGLMKYELVCFDTSGCQAGFGRWQLLQVLDPSIMQRLDLLQQQDEISKAGLDGLSDCPFCEFKAICPPVDEDKEFRCFNSDCEKVSCRLCREESHIPMSCEEYQKDRGVTTRHLVEEAMSEALIRKCPRCTLPIVKETGCNKMVCSKCHCIMCYVCKMDTTKSGYEHFRKGPKPCTLHDERDRQQDDIDRAEQEAIEKARAANPDLDREILRVQQPRSQSNQEVRRPAHPPPRHLPRPVLVRHVGLHRDGRVAAAPRDLPARYDARYGPPEWGYAIREHPVGNWAPAMRQVNDPPLVAIPADYRQMPQFVLPGNFRRAADFGPDPHLAVLHDHLERTRRELQNILPVPLPQPIRHPGQRAGNQQAGVNPGARRNAHAHARA